MTNDPQDNRPPEGEDLVREIARREREADADGFWHRRTFDTATPEDEEELQARLDGPEEARLDDEVFRPLGEDFHRRTMGRLQKIQLEPKSKPQANVLTHRLFTRSKSQWLAAAALLLVALGLGYMLRSGTPALPAYEAELAGRVQDQRSLEAESDEVATFQMGGPFVLTLRPAGDEEVTDPLRWKYFLESTTDGSRRPWVPATQLTTSRGAVRIEGSVGEEIDLPPGEWTLVAVYGTGELPTMDDVQTDSGRGWRAVRIPLRVLPKQAALNVEFGGACYTVLAGPLCVPYAAPYNELGVWVASENGGIELTLDGNPVDDPGTDIEGGRLFRVEVSSNNQTLEIRDSAGESWRLQFSRPNEPDWLSQASHRLFDGQTEGLAEELDERLSELDDPSVEARVHSLLAKLVTSEEERWDHLQQAIDNHRAAGQISEMVLDLSQQLNILANRRRFQEMRALLDRLEQALDDSAPTEAFFELHYNRMLLQAGLGDLRSALESYRHARGLARRTGLQFQEAVAQEQAGLLLLELARYDEATKLFAGLPPSTGCGRVRQLSNHAWALIQARRAGSEVVGNPRALIDQGLDLTAEGCDELLRLDLGLNKVLSFADDGLTAEALRALVDVEPSLPAGSALQRLWANELEGRLALLDGRAGQALESYARMERLAEEAFAPKEQWLARLGKARVLEAQGEAGVALEAFAEAEQLLDKNSLQVPLHEGRDLFLAERETGARLHVDLLLKEGLEAEALATARRSRARVLRGLRGGHQLAHLGPEARARWDAEIATYLATRQDLEREAGDDWRLSESELATAQERRRERSSIALAALDRAFEVLAEGLEKPALPPLPTDELVLVYHPLPRGWVGFAAAGEEITVQRLDLPERINGSFDGDELTRRLLEPFRAQLATAPRLRLLPYGALRDIDFHALPWDGDVLLAHLPVVYGLDLETPDDASTDRRALVVADPRGDLPAARHEGQAVTRMLQEAGWQTHELPENAALASTVRTWLEDVDLFHYAGHGTSSEASGWQSGLELASGTRLPLGDVMALENAPQQVVLSSCETARTASPAPLASFGLAHAFLVAGSTEVVAAVRRVGDSDTARLFRTLYPAESLADALRQAQLEWRQEDPGADWASFRVLVP